MVRYSIKEIQRKSLKPTDCWMTVLLLDPIAIRLVWLVANFTKLSPNQITVLQLPLVLTGSFFFFGGTHFYLFLGAIMIWIAYLLDCVDGKLARLKGMESAVGKRLDGLISEIIFLSCLLGLCLGQYNLAHNSWIILVGGICYTLKVLDGVTTNLRFKNLKRRGINLEKNPRLISDRLITPFSTMGRIKKRLANRRINLMFFDFFQLGFLIFIVGPILNLVYEVLVVGVILYGVWILALNIILRYAQ